MKGALAIPEFLRREITITTKGKKMTDTHSAKMASATTNDIENNEEIKNIVSEIAVRDEKIKELQKEKSTLRRQYHSALGKLITVHIREQLNK